MKIVLCLVVVVFAAVAVNAETPEAEASQAKGVILVKSAPQPLRPKPTLAAYKPIPLKIAKPKAVLIPIQPQPLRPKPVAIKVVPVPTVARKPIKPLQPINTKGAPAGGWWG